MEPSGSIKLLASQGGVCSIECVSYLQKQMCLAGRRLELRATRFQVKTAQNICSSTHLISSCCMFYPCFQSFRHYYVPFITNTSYVMGLVYVIPVDCMQGRRTLQRDIDHFCCTNNWRRYGVTPHFSKISPWLQQCLFTTVATREYKLLLF